METITFYSYKGGTGRTLLVAHAARYLALLGRRVVALDLDLEAPGLHYRLNIGAPGERTEDIVPGPGVVDYLHESLAAGHAPEAALTTFIRPVATPANSAGRLWLMPAGPAPSGAYWKRLTALFQMDPFLDAKGLALAAVLDLKARIEDEYQPDHLLIDSRTGITELGGIATSVMANKVVCLFTDNRESLDGAAAVMSSLGQALRPSGQQPVEVFPVLSRVSERDNGAKARVLRLLKEQGEAGRDEPGGFDGLFLLRTDPRVDEITDEPPDVRAGLRSRPLHEVELDPARWRTGVYRDYRVLMSAVAPADPDAAAPAWSRQEAVQDMLDWLTDDSVARSSWSESASFDVDQIDEGVSLGGRFADLVAFSDRDRTEALLAAVYIEGDLAASTASNAWPRNSRLRCVILFNKPGGRLEKRIFTRRRSSWDLVERTEKEAWAIRWPASFSALDDPGDLSTAALLRSVQQGEYSFISVLVGRWQHASLFGLHGGGPFDPRAAREILDGLAAVRDLDAERQILWATTPDRFGRHHGGDMDGGDMERQTTRELHAPLWWRLSGSAKIGFFGSHHGPRHGPRTDPMELLSLDLLGLAFDQNRDLRDEHTRLFGPDADRASFQSGFLTASRERELKLQLSDDAPPELIRRVLLDRDRQGVETHRSNGDAWEQAAATSAESLPDDEALTRLLRGADGQLCVITTNLLGGYESSTSRVVVYTRLVAWCAGALGVDQRALENVVLLHETVHALCHLGRDLDGRMWDEFCLPSSQHPAFRPSALHEGLAQYFTYRMIERLADEAMMAAFSALTEVQTPEYQQWRAMRDVPLERVRDVLVQARAGLADSLIALR